MNRTAFLNACWRICPFLLRYEFSYDLEYGVL